MPSLDSRTLLVLAVALLVLWFGSLGYRKLIKSDEGRYAEIAREMAVTGDWVTPRLNGIKYFEKPPLQYWATAAAYMLFGQHEWTARLWSALTGLLGIALTWWAGRRLFGPLAGAYAAIVLASSLMYVVLGHLNTLDMGLNLFLFTALIAFLRAQRDQATPRENALWMYAAWAAAGGAVLSKGIVGVLIPVATLLLYSLIQRDWRPWRRLHPIAGLPLFLVIAVPWFVVVSMRNPEFAWFFFVHEHWLRYTTTIHHRIEPWYYFIPVLAAGALPWTLVMLEAVWRAWKPEPVARFQVRRFLVIWCAFVFVFFSISGSKMPSYLLPLLPAAALLMGWRLTSMRGTTLAWQIAPLILLAALAIVALQFVKTSGTTPVEVIEAYKRWLAAAAVLSIGTASYATWVARRGNVTRAVVVIGLSGLVSAQLIISGHESVSPSMSAYRTAQEVKPYLKPGVPFYSVSTYDQTLDFYLGRTVTLVQYRDEMDYGLQQEPQLAIATIDEWKRIWKQQPYALALVEKGLYRQLESEGFPMRLIANDHSRYYIRTP